MLSSDFNAEEVHNKLQEVLKENIDLKEALQQNNLAMKQQFTTLSTWNEEVLSVHQSHKSKFDEMKTLIVKVCKLPRLLPKANIH
jgi:NF-kappa-B essential modulator NEMO